MVKTNRVRPASRARREPERGHSTVLVAVVIALAALLGVGVARVAGVVVDRARAQRGADAVALAVAVEIDPGAARHVADVLADANGVRIVRVDWVGGTAVVRVRSGGADAVAAARPAAR